ncbi:MAG: hypothetical protein H7836_17080, partial [Magnetococcus sp. YQC-3]
YLRWLAIICGLHERGNCYIPSEAAHYRIETADGCFLGAYAVETEGDAILAFAHDCGYSSVEEMHEVADQIRGHCASSRVGSNHEDSLIITKVSHEFTYLDSCVATLLHDSGNTEMVTIPDQVADDQEGWDIIGNAPFPAIMQDGTVTMVCLDPFAYDLWADGTGDCCVRTPSPEDYQYAVKPE